MTKLQTLLTKTRELEAIPNDVVSPREVASLSTKTLTTIADLSEWQMYSKILLLALVDIIERQEKAIKNYKTIAGRDMELEHEVEQIAAKALGGS